MIEARDITLSFGERALLREVSFQLNDRGRICLAGPNGTGKSTLFSILMGELQPDSGQVIRSGGTRMGILRQHAEFQKAETPFTATRLAFAPLLEKAKVVDEFHHAMGVRELTDEEMHRLDVLQDALVREGYYSLEAEVRAVLSGLGFAPEAQDRPLEEFSGGWNMRVALAQLLLSKPDCMLLDEPTNHLDLESIVWLEEYLRAYPGSLILVCHDRRFVDKVCESVMEIRQGRLEIYSLPFVRYEEERAMRTALQMKAASKAQDEIERLTLFIDRFKAKASKASLARSAMKKLDRVEVVEVDRETSGLRLRFPTLEYMGSIAYQVEDLAKSYGEKKVFEKGDFTISPGDKVALVGPNGAGKSTLMRLLAGEEDPSAGQLRRGGNLKAGYYAQYVEPGEKELRTPILDILRDAFPEARDGQARSALGAMLFSGDDALKPLKVLSGGERARVRLAKLLLAPGNTLLLDEPTNHLDLRSKDLLLEALKDYPGTVVFVSHDRDFCDALATRVVRVDEGRIVEYPGDFSYYLHKVEQDTRAAQKLPGKTAKPNPGSKVKEAENRPEPDRKKFVKRLGSVTERIAGLEKRTLAIDEEMCREEIFSDGGAMRRLTDEKSSLTAELESLYAEWMSAAGGENE